MNAFATCRKGTGTILDSAAVGKRSKIIFCYILMRSYILSPLYRAE